MPIMLPRDVQSKLVHFLAEYLQDPNVRHLYLQDAFAGTGAIHNLDLAGPSWQFTNQLVDHLERLGPVAGKPALVHFIQSLRAHFGHEAFQTWEAELNRFYANAQPNEAEDRRRSTATENAVPPSPPDPDAHDDPPEAIAPAQAAAVLTVEVVSYTTLSGRHQARVYAAFTNTLNRVVRPVQNRTSIHWTLAGNGISLTMPNPDYALNIALRLADSVRRQGDPNYHVRIGLHTGIIYLSPSKAQNRNVWGPGVQVATRVMDMAEPDQILASLDFCRDLDLLNGGTPPVKGLAVTPIGERLLQAGEALTVYNLAAPGVGLSLEEDFDAWIATFNSPIERTVAEYKALLEAYRNRERVRPNLHALQIAALARRLLTLLPEVTAHNERQDAHIAYETIEQIGMAREDEGSTYYHFFLSNLKESLAYFLRVARLVRFRRGMPLFRAGDTMNALLFVVAGQVQVPNGYGAAEQRTGEGLVVGEWGLFAAGARHPMTVTAATEVIALVIHYDDLDERRHPPREHADIRTIQRLLWEKVYTRSVIREVLTTHPLFRNLHPSDLDGALRSATFYPASLDPGSPPTVELLERSWFVVVAGELRLTARINSGGPFNIRYVPGDVVGIVHLSDYHFNDRTYMNYVQGLQVDPDTQLIRLSWRQIRRLLDENIPFHHQCIDRYNEAVVSKWYSLLDEIPQAIND